MPFFTDHPVPQLIIDAAGERILASNRAAHSRCGCTDAELLSLAPCELVAPSEREQFRRLLIDPAAADGSWPASTEVCGHGASRRAEIRIYPASFLGHGHRLAVVIDVAERPERDQTEAVPHTPAGHGLVRGGVRDVSSDRQVGFDLARSQDRLRLVLRAIPDLWFVMDAEGRYEEVSDPEHPSLAGSWDDACGRHFDEVVPIEVAALADAALQVARAHQRVQRIEYALKVRDGRSRRFEARIAPIDDGRWLYLARDVTEALEAQEALKESESRYARAERGTADGIWEWDIHSGYNYLSPRWKQLLGFASEELLNHESTFFERLHPEDVDRCRQAVAHHLELREPYDVEVRLRMRDGSYRWFRSRGEAEYGTDSRPFRMTGSISDITDRKHAEQALRESEAKLNAVFALAPVGLALASFDDGVLQAANEEVCRILGRPLEAALGRRIVDLGAWTNAAEREEAMAQVRLRGFAERDGVMVRRPDGKVAWTLVRLQRLELGNSNFVLAAITDLTDRLSAEQALRESEAKFSAVFRIAPVGITLSTLDRGVLLAINDEGCRLAGRTKEELVGLQGVNVGLWNSDSQREQLLRPLRSGERISRGDVALKRPDGSTLRVSMTAVAIDLAGVATVISSFVDMSDRLAAQELLEQQRSRDVQHRDELMALTRQLMDQDQRSSQLLALLLHDRLAQTLTALRLAIEHGSHAGAGRAAAGSLVDQAIAEMRLVLGELRPPLLEEHGLPAALENFLAVLEQRHGGHCELLLAVAEPVQAHRPPPEVEYAVFMIAREAVLNSLQHAHGTMIRVALDGGLDGLQLEVSDDGVGFDTQFPSSPPGHLGLVGMRERSRAIGASLTLARGVDGGASVVVSWERGNRMVSFLERHATP